MLVPEDSPDSLIFELLCSTYVPSRKVPDSLWDGTRNLDDELEHAPWNFKIFTSKYKNNRIPDVVTPPFFAPVSNEQRLRKSISNINEEMDEDSSSSITISVLNFESAKFKDVNVDDEFDVEVPKSRQWWRFSSFCLWISCIALLFCVEQMTIQSHTL